MTGDERRSVAALLVSVFCGSAAVFCGITALGKLVYDITARELDLGLLGLAEFAPAALLVLVTGSVADRFDRRRVSALSAIGEAIVAVGIAAYVATRPTSVGPIFLLVIALGIGRAFNAPASRSLPADIVTADRLPWLVPRFSATWQFAFIAGPVLGGFLYAVDPAFPFIAMAALLTISGAAVSSVKVRSQRLAADATSYAANPAAGAEAPPRRLAHAFEGLRFIGRRPLLLGAIGLDLFAVLFGGAVALLPAIAEDRLGIGAVGLGWLRAAGGIGAGAVTLVIARYPLRRNLGHTLMATVALFGAGTVMLGLTASYVVALMAMAVIFGADAISVYIRATLVPLATPAHMRGRVLAVENVFIGASNELGAFESGLAGQAFGAAPAIVIGGVATLGIVGVWWFAFPALRDLDEFPASPDADAHATALAATS